MIGHEIGHGFDDQGAKYDGDGNLVNWWTDDDRAEFGARTKALIEQYDAYTPRALDGEHHVNGAFTVGENIGDLGGLSIALLAYQLSLNGRPAPVIDGLTGVQRVFFGWAQVWRAKSRDAESIRRLAVDPHSPPEFRCNGVIRNVDAFTRPLTSPRRMPSSWSRAAGSASGIRGRGPSREQTQNRTIWRLSVRFCVCSARFDARGHVLVPGRTGVGVAPLGGGERIRRDARNDGSPIVIGVVEPKTVGQGGVSGLHRLGDLDGRLGAAGRGGDASPASVDESNRLRVFNTDAQRPSASRFRQDGSRKMSLAV